MFLGKSGRWILVLMISVIPFFGFAQKRNLASIPDVEAPSRWQIGTSYSLFNEKLVLRQAGFSGESIANYQGYAVFAEKFYFLKDSLWSIGLEAALGRANTGGGGGEFFTYERNRQAWWSVSPYARYALRLSGQVSLGVRAGPLYKNVNWPSLQTNVNVQKTDELGILALAELQLRFNRWEIQQGLGAFGMGSGTYWRLAVGYIF